MIRCVSHCDRGWGSAFRGFLMSVLAIVAIDRSAHAAPVLRYSYQKGTTQIEITALLPQIIRVRAGRSQLPEDASWAVLPASRTRLEPLQVRESGDVTLLETSALVMRLDRKTLAITVQDRHGRVVLADATDAARSGLSFGEQGFQMRMVMPQGARYFALGDKTGPLDRRDGSFTLWNSDHYGFGPASDPLYKSIPFVLSANEAGEAFGFFLDNHWRTNFDFGKAERDILSVTAEGGPVDYYVMAGPTPKAVVQQYAWLTGTASLTPLWALGFQQSHWSYRTQKELEGVADRLRADKIPADVLYTDIDYQDRNRPFTINRRAFPDFPGMVSKLKSQGLHLVMITDLHVADAPGQGYGPYDSGVAADIFLKQPNGSLYSGEVWPGAAVFPDFSSARARQWWGDQYRDFVGIGVIGFWNDMNEPSIFNVHSKTMPLDVVHRIEEPGFVARTASHAEMHNVYGMLNSQATYEGMRRLAPDQRPFVLTRATYAGGQRYAATWTGDNLSRWDHLKLSVPMLINLGLSGFAYAGDDIGGFGGEHPAPDLLTRWIEWGAFNPIFRDHYSDSKPPQEPWVDGPEHEAIRRKYIEERYRLMPYIYGLAEENSRSGMPMMRPVFLEYPQVLASAELFSGSEDEFMLGADLLVAPSPTPESAATYSVALPGDGWYDYWTGKQRLAHKTDEVPTLSRLPVFVRPGAIIPKQPLVQSTAVIPQGRLTLAIYPGSDCRGSLYLDDGTSFGYVQGQYLRQTFGCRQTNTELLLTFAKRDGGYAPWWTGIELELHGVKESATALLGGKHVATHFDPQAECLSIEIPDLAVAATLHIALHRARVAASGVVPLHAATRGLAKISAPQSAPWPEPSR